MSNLRMVEATLPPGFRFHPRDEELICDYLMKKVTRSEVQPPLMIQVDLNHCEPWDIPETACVGGKEWYFYSRRDRKYATGLRTNRATISGYWKATGKDRSILRKRTLVGMRKTLVFYQGRAPKGRKTDWVMHEFRLEGPLAPPKCPSAKEDWVLCRVFYKNREVAAAKQGMGGNSYGYEDTTSSLSLPPLMDPYTTTSATITFDKTQTQIQIPNPISCSSRNNDNNNDECTYEQVPCFSICTGSVNETNFSHMMPTHTHTHMDPMNLSSTKINATTQPIFGSIPVPADAAAAAAYPNPSFSCEIKAVLSHLNNMKQSPSSFGEEGISDQSFSGVGLPATMWYHYNLS